MTDEERRREEIAAIRECVDTLIRLFDEFREGRAADDAESMRRREEIDREFLR